MRTNSMRPGRVRRVDVHGRLQIILRLRAGKFWICSTAHGQTYHGRDVE